MRLTHSRHHTSQMHTYQQCNIKLFYRNKKIREMHLAFAGKEKGNIMISMVSFDTSLSQRYRLCLTLTGTTNVRTYRERSTGKYCTFLSTNARFYSDKTTALLPQKLLQLALLFPLGFPSALDEEGERRPRRGEKRGGAQISGEEPSDQSVAEVTMSDRYKPITFSCYNTAKR